MEDRGNNVINNYKGVMLCSRPNQNNNAPVERPFCGRVYNHQQVGLVPVRRDGSPPPQQKKELPSILSKHKRWLEQFKEKQQKVKEQLEQKQKQEEEKFKKIREIAEADRERAKKMKNQYNQTATQVLNILDQSPASSRPGELNAANLRRLDEANEQRKKVQQDKDKDKKREKPIDEPFKKQKKIKKPGWAITQKQREQKQQEQVDELLDFFDNTAIDQFSQDEQVKSILKNLKDKIQQIKEKEDWRERQAKKIQQREEQRRLRRQANRDDDDKLTHASGNSQAKSVASQRAQKNIEELKKKKEEGQQEWDKHTVSSKQSYANIDERIAKNLADEVLRNYPHLRGVHSNVSIRKLLQAEASRAINQPIPRPVITTIIKQPKPMDTNNLPYLHRNPSI